MPKRKQETPAPSASTTNLSEHLAAVEAQEAAPKIKRHIQLRPAVSSESPAPGRDISITPAPIVIDDDDEALDEKSPKKKRELASSKRAKQNREAQRAFRERKAGHIAELEDKVNRLQAVTQAHKKLQIQNHHYRDYVETLQRLLIGSGISVPFPPMQLELPAQPPTVETEARAAEAAHIARLSASGRYARATSAEIVEISDEAIRQRDTVQYGRIGMTPVTPGPSPMNGLPNSANIEPTLMDSPSQQAPIQAA